MYRICNICKQSKNLEENFYLSGNNNRRNQCKECCKIYDKKYSLENKTKKKLYDSQEYVKLKRKNNEMIKLYGIDINQKKKLFKDQKGLCKISKKPLDFNKCHIDHNHKTGEIRGLLENSMNRAIGLFEENIDLLEKSIKYLENTKRIYDIQKIIENNRKNFILCEKDLNWTKLDIDRNYKFRSRYKITLFDYYNILEYQNNLCALSSSNDFHLLYVDHYIDNNFPIIRGLIKNNYNLGLGFLKHDINLIKSSISYLQKY